MDLSAYLTETQMAAEIAARPGLIPVALEGDSSLVRWIDLKKYHCYEGFFSDSLAVYRGLPGKQPREYTCALKTLASLRVPEDSIYPTGFIFHTARCGSTLLTRVLARSRAHLVFGEAAPHNQIWRALAGFNNRESEIYRKLLLLMGRRRLPSYCAHIVKFTSFNLLRFNFIRAVFPDVPVLVLFGIRNTSFILWSARLQAGSVKIPGLEPIGAVPRLPLRISFAPPPASAILV